MPKTNNTFLETLAIIMWVFQINYLFEDHYKLKKNVINK